MWASIGAALTILAAVVTWWLRGAPERLRTKRLQQIQELEDAYGRAMATGDELLAADTLRRIRLLTLEAGHPPR